MYFSYFFFLFFDFSLLKRKFFLAINFRTKFYLFNIAKKFSYIDCLQRITFIYVFSTKKFQNRKKHKFCFKKTFSLLYENFILFSLFKNHSFILLWQYQVCSISFCIFLLVHVNFVNKKLLPSLAWVFTLATHPRPRPQRGGVGKGKKSLLFF